MFLGGCQGCFCFEGSEDPWGRCWVCGWSGMGVIFWVVMGVFLFRMAGRSTAREWRSVREGLERARVRMMEKKEKKN